MTTRSENFDLIVVGGGPGGSTLASFVAMRGHRVLLLEREKFPRHQIGESLLPATVHGICAMLGLTDELRRANFPIKRGGTFRWGKEPEPWTFGFTRNPEDPYGYAYQVERARFDDILLRNSARKGVDVREQHEVTEVLFEGDRAVGVRFRDAEGAEHEARARFIVDASGNRTRVSQSVGERVYSKFFQNVALYGYFENGKRLPAPRQGNILSAAFQDGWFWYIPLSDTLTSVGAVVSREAAEAIKDGHEAALFRYIERCPIIKDFLAPATRVTSGKYGEIRIRKDYSYCNTRFWKPGMALIGDAACFVDPVFSSGVHLATYSALLVARAVNTCLAGAMSEERCFSEFEQRYRREFGNFYQFLVAFYDMNQDTDSYFWSARKIVHTEERANDAFVRLVAGRSQMNEPAFQGLAEGFFSAREGFGAWFGELVSDQEKGGGRPPVMPARAARDGREQEFEPGGFMQGFTREISELQHLAMFGADRAPEAPLWSGGLVPSKDGLAWSEVARP
ncbi:tryptophan 7-halogenase [Chondromyces apiculatus]|uniref:FAD-binding protein n=1 Tax=Chondromyces apiculatus DSM 436 TaxID=1192034 RepID=A0A017SW11_9BACT|nr:tryptophan 7-halogenase [Chondromyces apiculatus]EYF00486.1 FAD-binding protein [Chondromyces apiculatus DSM 436]